MRVSSLVIFAVVGVLALGAVASAIAQSAATPGDSGSISRDATGSQTTRDHDPLGGPPTPRVYGLGQGAIMTIGVVLLAVAAVLGAYTVLITRRPHPRP